MSRADLVRWTGFLTLGALATLPLRAIAQAPATPDPGFDAITQQVGNHTHDQSVAAMTAWVDAHPSDANAGRGLVWMGDLRFSEGRLDLAYPLFQRAERDYAHTDWGLHAKKGRADIDMLQHRFTAAIEAYDALAAGPTAYWQYVGRIMANVARKAQIRFYAYVACLILMTLGLGYRIWHARRRLWPMPEELLYVLPVALLMLVASAGQPPEEAHAVCLVALGGILILWANGADRRIHPPQTRTRRLTEGLLGLAQSAALLYCSVMASGVWEKFEETLKAGADR